MPYVLIKPELAESFNRGLYRLTRPNAVRNPDDVTDTYCNVLYHPTNGWAALDLPDVDTVPLHLQADGSEMQDVLAAFVADGALTQQEADAITTAVIAYCGSEVRIADFIPASWQPYVFTRAELESQGWFPDVGP